LGDDFILVSNEVMKARAGVLAANVAIWGDPNIVVTSDDPIAFSALPGYFDIILADVPCSGEGMFRKDDEAVRQWSEDNVALCQARQRRILADVWPSLAPDGVFMYSTCTFNRYENDLNVLWAAEELGGECLYKEDVLGGMPGVIRTEVGYSLIPGHVMGEGQYCSALRKTGFGPDAQVRMRPSRPSRGAKEQPLPKGLDSLVTKKVVFRQKGETVTAVPENLSSDVTVLEQALHVIAAGCALGVAKGKNFIPDADLALSMMLSPDAYPTVDVDRETALAYLHRDAVTFPGAPLGILTVRYQGHPLGFVKNLGNRCNSLHPQSRRIRMDIR
jgi:NOL1/NOP2/fmu family ribosome biogenesis protein